MSQVWNWVKTNKNNPCPICGKPDWCTVCPEKGVVLCMRTQSARPSKNDMGGWLHSISPTTVQAIPRTSKPEPEKLTAPKLDTIWHSWYQNHDRDRLTKFARSLGVTPYSLEMLNCVWTGEAWAFPMFDAERRIIGIRIRDESGKKWALRGSRNGLFIPLLGLTSELYIVEGPTDTAAALTLGKYALGRPNNSACVELIVEFVNTHPQIRRVIIVSDNDQRRCPKCKRVEEDDSIETCPDDRMKFVRPGWDGARKLQDELKLDSTIWIPPAKDLREYVLRLRQ